MVELLAPVGSWEALVAAVESGANAVYLAGKMFGARAYADNFDEEMIKKAIAFAHMRDVLVNVTVNTLVDSKEMPALAEYLRFLYEAGADAVLVQDLGVVKLARQVAPHLPLHASTQMTVHNLEGVRALEALGFSRVVLSREMSLADISYICANAKAEIEVFVHGALCVCYSGQCLMSSMIGGRSGNRGRCAQPCRLPYTLVDQSDEDLLKDADAGQYLLSPRDLNTLEILPQLIDAGVASLKIEGRMKRPEYVATVVDTYRRAIDQHLELSKEQISLPEETRNLAQIFNRDFTTAYMVSRPGRFMMSDRRPNNRGVLAGRVVKYDWTKKMVTVKLAEALSLQDIVDFWVKVGGRVSTTIEAMWVNGKPAEHAEVNEVVTFALSAAVREHDRVFKVFDAALMERARAFFQAGAPVRRFALDIRVEAHIGQPMTITAMDEDGYEGEAQTTFIAEKARKRALDEESVKKQIDRLGTSVFYLRNLTCDIGDLVMVPVSEINEARRQAVEAVLEKRMEKYKRPPLKEISAKVVFPPVRAMKKTQPELAVHVDTLEKAEAALRADADWIVFGGDSYEHRVISRQMYADALQLAKRYGKKVSFDTPRIVQPRYMAAQKQLLEDFRELSPQEICVQNIAFLPWGKELGSQCALRADLSMNVYNPLAISFLQELGAKAVTLSPELTMVQAEDVIRRSVLPVECVVHGNLELMVSAYCAMGSYLGKIDQGACSQPCQSRSFWLKDRKDEKFPLVTDQFCQMHLLNGKELSMLPHVPKFGSMGADRIRIEAKYMKPRRIEEITRLYKGILLLGDRHPLLQNEQQMEKTEGGQITRGHYFRGVL